MTRRILVGLLALAALLLGGAVLPLGLETADHYRIDYADATMAQARALASVAEERLSDHEANLPLKHGLARYLGPTRASCCSTRQAPAWIVPASDSPRPTALPSQTTR